MRLERLKVIVTTTYNLDKRDKSQSGISQQSVYTEVFATLVEFDHPLLSSDCNSCYADVSPFENGQSPNSMGKGGAGIGRCWKTSHWYT